MKSFNEFSESLANDTTLGNTIICYHLGRGGRFYNSGHKTVIDVHGDINNYTEHLFTSFENYFEISKKLKTYKNLTEKLINCLENEDFSFFENKFGFNFGKKIYVTCDGNSVGLDVDNMGIGCINIDYDYDTTYCCKLKDIDENEYEILCQNEKRIWIPNELLINN